MKERLRHFFVPHAGNNYHPHVLHTKRAIFYSLVFLLMKGIVILFVLLIPVQAFVLPDVILEQQKKIIDLTNDLRLQKGKTALNVAAKLDLSADAKAQDMADNHYFSHVGPNNRTLAFFLKKADYPYKVAGENLAMGFTDAQSVVRAWIKSPTHYANLIDNDFSEIGLGIEQGLYNGRDTVYVAQHFGTRQTVQNAQEAREFADKASLQVKSVKIVAETSSAQPIVFDAQKSRIFWFAEGEKTRFVVRAFVSGPVRSATVNVLNYPIELSLSDQSESYRGSLTVLEPVANFFKPVIVPAIEIVGEDGSVRHFTIDWHDVKVVEMTPIDKYFQAKELLGPITNIFSVSRGVYAGFIIFFGAALIINILVEIRRQHYHVILQTLILLAFLVVLRWL